MQNTGLNQKPSPPATFESGFVESVDRKETRAGKPMLTIKINQKDVSFFDDSDVTKEISIGDQIQFQCIQKGQYWNGKGLQQVRNGTPISSTILPQTKSNLPARTPNIPQNNTRNPTPPSVSQTRPNSPSISTNRATIQIHNLSADQLNQLYIQIQAEGQAEPAFLGQISNQIRYARIEEILRQVIETLVK